LGPGRSLSNEFAELLHLIPTPVMLRKIVPGLAGAGIYVTVRDDAWLDEPL
jgi:hypothetical protein